VHDGGRTATAGAGTIRWRRTLVAGQFALTLALVVTAGLLVRTLLNLRSIPTGLDVAHVALVGVDPGAAQYDATRTRAYIGRATERVAALPGVRAVGYGRVIPLGFGGSRMTIGVPDYVPAPDEDMEINYNIVSPGYFDALGIEILDGRPLASSDVSGGPVAVVVNETMARRYWPDGRAVGRTMSLPGDSAALEVVGVARDAKYRTIREDARPSFYLSALQLASPRAGVFHVRADGEPTALLDTLRQAIAEVDPAVPVTHVSTLREQVSTNVARERLTMVIGLVLSGSALLLSAVGLFGATATLVGNRTREMGVRLALGAVPGQLASLVLREGLRTAAWGGAVGLALVVWLGRVVESRLYGVGAFDPVSLTAGLVLLTAVAVLAAWLPARRAARVDPVDILRTQ
jgi:predicted permease